MANQLRIQIKQNKAALNESLFAKANTVAAQQ
jgi:hypothetical protein